MIIDTSALLAILRMEPESAEMARLIDSATSRRISAANYVEAAAIIDRAGDPVASRTLDQFLEVAAIIIEPVTAQQAQIAREAYRDFGKGSGHQAGLNFGDCFAYALAKDRHEPLLFKGKDFSKTDVESANE